MTLHNFLRDERGAIAIEYGLLVFFRHKMMCESCQRSV